ncbi:hypothetical protein GDO86_010815 [Hymenochirus boettgeri]|uniref:Syndecan n=1 Tax=Hymenochirus boettgeri TaxID=247094 RepID=A0A8T2JE24_9PIPI|nr:hypothetical protein GDO86_010815 [Hymenochirus boettgeri]KAG8441779.1 hypothetical protein GDO86_010815 [Hymenochirus boettgeri]
MRNIWLILPIALITAVSGGETWVEADKDLYIDNTSIEDGSGIYPIDDDDYTSGSGSGTLKTEDEDENVVLSTLTTLINSPSSEIPYFDTTTLKAQTKMAAETKEPGDVETTDEVMVRGGPHPDTGKEIIHTAKHTENLFHRTEVLAAVIAGGGIGFLFAVFLILLLVYRMRKKDEGSYDLGERKPSSAVYQKAPTKEFYA